MPGDTENITWRAQLALRGISRREAAGALSLSLSALDKRLKGEVDFTAGDMQKMAALTGKGMKA